MKILIAITPGLLAPQLPDHPTTFKEQEIVDYTGNRYLFADYVGVKNLTSDVDVAVYETYAAVRLAAEIAAALPTHQLITKGAFWQRVTDAEYERLVIGAETSVTLAKAMEEVRGRTHIDTKSDRLLIVLEGLRDSGILDTAHGADYDNRIEELLRPGTDEDAYHP